VFWLLRLESELVMPWSTVVSLCIDGIRGRAVTLPVTLVEDPGIDAGEVGRLQSTTYGVLFREWGPDPDYLGLREPHGHVTVPAKSWVDRHLAEHGGVFLLAGRWPTLSTLPTRSRGATFRRLEMTGKRIRSLDATRGTAMIFVLISHFGLTYFGRNGQEHLEDWFERIGKVASPTFMVLSGMMAGFLYAMRRESFRTTRMRLVDRGLFFLTFGHVVIAFAHVPRLGRFDWALYEVYITDTIAFSIIVGPFLVEVLRPRARLALGVALFVASWAAMELWPVYWHSWWRAALVGELPAGPTSQYGIYTFPVLPWFATYLAGTSLGAVFAARLQRDGEAGAARLMLHIGGASVLLALVCAKAGGVARDAGLIDREGLVATLAYLGCKRPPGPVYLLFHGGAGLLLLAATMTVDRLRRLDAWLHFTTLMGRTSFFVFVVQFFVFNQFFFRARLPMSPAWPLYFAATVAVVGLASWWWDAGGYNRFMTMRILRGRTAPDERQRTT
jgi:uncharacterized membrane protein